MSEYLGLSEKGEDKPNSYSKYLKDAFSEYIRYTECKRLLNQISSAQEAQGFRSVAVISQDEREGKSFLVLVLAMGYALLLNRKVLVVDAVSQTKNRSLYRNRILEAEHTNGNSNYGVIDLLTTKSLEEGEEESSDFQIGPYADSLRDDYDLIVFDTCAIRGAQKDNMDPIIISKSADVAILLTSMRSLDRENLRKLKQELKRWNIKLLGSVFNTVLRA